MFEFVARSAGSPRLASLAIDVLRKPRLWIPTEKDYPSHGTWLEKVEAELQQGKKRAMIGFFGKVPVGAVIYQRHPEQYDTLEIRNISISPEVGNRYIGSFLLRNSEIEAAAQDFPGVSQSMVDTKVANRTMLSFLEGHGYALRDSADLYGSGQLDAILVKSLAN